MVFSLPLPKRDTRIIAGLLALNVLLRVLVAIRPLEYLDGLTIPDDAYLSLTIARNIAHGLGPLYGFEHTNGFQPLLVFLTVPAFLFFPGEYIAPIRFTLFLLVLFDTLTLYLLYRLTASQTDSRIAPTLVSTAWIVNPYFIGTTFNGMETILSVFCIVAVISYYIKSGVHGGTHNSHRLLMLGILTGIAILARIDNALLATALVLVLVWKHRALSVVQLCRISMFIALGILIVTLPWFLYSYHYTEDVFPISGSAVRFISLAEVRHQPTFDNWYLPMMGKAAKAFSRKNWLLVGLLIAMSIIVLRRGIPIKALTARAYGQLAPALLYAPLLAGAYTFYIFTPWFFLRYFFPIAVVILMTFGLFAARFFELVKEWKHCSLMAGIMLVVIIAGNVSAPYFRELFFSTDTTTFGYMNAGLWARQNLPDGTILGAPQSGAIGYFADNLRVINLDGVVNKACYNALKQHRSMEYVRSTGIEYVMGWKMNIDFVTAHSRNFHPEELVMMHEIRDFTSWGAPWHVMRVSY